MDPTGTRTPSQRPKGFGPIPGLEPPDEPSPPRWPYEPDPERPAAGHNPSHHHDPDPGEQSFFKRRIAPLGVAILAFLAKVKSVLLVLGQVKLFATSATMVVSLLAYASIWGFSFALGLVILLLVHEYGHVLALRREGIKPSAPMFVPFMGAFVTAPSLGKDAAAQARVALAGPILGSLGAAVCLLVWRLTGHDYWQALAFTGFFLNLFNLLPVVPLDGGRAMAAMTPWMWIAGAVAIVVLAVAFPNPVILIIAVFALLETYKRFRARREGGDAQQAYYRVSPRNRALVAAVYLSLVALLVVGMDATHLHRTIL